MSSPDELHQIKSLWESELGSAKRSAGKNNLGEIFANDFQGLERSEQDSLKALEARQQDAGNRIRKAQYEIEDSDGSVAQLSSKMEVLTRDSDHSVSVIKKQQEMYEQQIKDAEQQHAAIQDETDTINKEGAAEQHAAQSSSEQADQAHAQELADLKAQKIRSQALIDEHKRGGLDQSRAKKQREAKTRLDHEYTMSNIRNELHNQQEVLKGINAQTKNIEAQAAEAQRIVHEQADDVRARIDEKQRIHDEGLQGQRDRGLEQANRIKTLREFPEMIQEYKATEDEIVKLEYDTADTDERIAEMRRDHYLGTSNHKEKIYFLEKELERSRSSNYRTSNRIAYSLRDPIF